MYRPTYSCKPVSGNLRSINQAMMELSDWRKAANSWETELIEWCDEESYRLSKMAVTALRRTKNWSAAIAKYSELAENGFVVRSLELGW